MPDERNQSALRRSVVLGMGCALPSACGQVKLASKVLKAPSAPFF